MMRRAAARFPALMLSLVAPLAGCPAAEPAPEPPPGPPPMSNLTPEQAQIYEEYKALALKNDCSGGFRGLSGRWRFVGQSRTPEYGAELTVKGTHFTEELRGKPDGRSVTAKLEGEIRCLFKNRVLMTVDRVRPEGAFDNRSGDAYPCDLLADMDPNHVRMLMICYFDWDLRPAAGREFEYERID